MKKTNLSTLKELINININENEQTQLNHNRPYYNSDIVQLDDKQAYILRISEYDFILYSYSAVIGIIDLRTSTAILTGHGQYSRTTSKHVTTFKTRLSRYLENVKVIYCNYFRYKSNERVLDDLIQASNL